MPTPEALTAEIQKLAPSAIIELFELNLTDLGGDIYYFHAGTNSLSQNIVWQGIEYVRYPIQASGFDFSVNSQLPRPRLQASNLFGSITALLLSFNDLVGAKVTRRRTLKKFLDAVNFPGGVNLTADDTAEFESDLFYVDRKISENRDIVELELTSAFDVQGVKLPLAGKSFKTFAHGSIEEVSAVIQATPILRPMTLLPQILQRIAAASGSQAANSDLAMQRLCLLVDFQVQEHSDERH